MKKMFMFAGLGVVVVMAVSVALTGSGTIGQAAPGWSVDESCTPHALGDSVGSVGAANLDAASTTDSVYAIDNKLTLTDALGSFSGQVVEAPVTGSKVHLSVKGGLGFLVADRTMPPVWANNANSLTFLTYGSGTGQVASVYDIAVDTSDNSIFVSSYGTVEGVDRYKVIKYSSAGVYITEFGAFGTGNGQMSGAFGLAVNPSDGSVYVGDGVNYRVQKFTTSGARTTYTYSTKVGTTGSGNGQFGSTQPITLVVGPSGNVFAADRGNNRIQKFTSSLVYSAKVTVSGTSTTSPYGMSSDGTYIYASSTSDNGTLLASGVIQKYNTSLVLQSTVTIAAPAGTSTGIGNFAFLSDGTFWAQWFIAPFLVHYTAAGVELERWYSSYPAALDLTTNYNLAVNSAGAIHVLFRGGLGSYVVNPYGGNFVTTFDYTPVTLSSAIQSYMLACDSTLGGYTYSYTASSNPNVVFPGWTGNVWAQLKDLCAIYKVEIALVGTVITVRDLDTRTLTIDNRTVPTISATNVNGGRQINIVHQNPSGGGGLMYDAATKGDIYTVDAGQTLTFTVRTDNHPVSLASMVPTDTLPVQPGQYYVVDSTGTQVPAQTWVDGGGKVTAAVGSNPGEIIFTLKGATGIGFTGPFTFATSRNIGVIPTFTVTGNGVTTRPGTVQLLTGADESKTTQQVAFTFDSPFMDTATRAYDRGVWASIDVAGPTVTVKFDVASESLAGFALTGGSTFTKWDSKWRVTDVSFGKVRSTITATRYVTAGEVDSMWSGQTLGTRDTYWSGKTAGARTIKPLAVT